ncbi:MAG: inositol monophosphatase family protein [Solirubrobacteraceae bacterium]
MLRTMPGVAGVSEDLNVALELADVADRITMARVRAADLVVETKPDLTPVSEADTAVERAIREMLAEVRPADEVFGEEYGGSDASAGSRRWIVDPIDGTKGYVRGIPVWATLLALQEDGEPSVAVVSAPAMRRRWWAARGIGAFTDDGLPDVNRPLRVSAISRLEDAQVSYGGLEDWQELGRADATLELVGSCWRSRNFGDFWAYMLVAEGAVEVALDPVVSLWDLAAPQLIVEEAGGRFTDLGGVRTAEGGDAIATNGLLHDATLAIIGR